MEAAEGEAARGKEGGRKRWGVREKFSLFVTLELGAEVKKKKKKKKLTVGSYKKQRGRGREQRERAGARGERSASPLAWRRCAGSGFLSLVSQGTTLRGNCECACGGPRFSSDLEDSIRGHLLIPYYSAC